MTDTSTSSQLDTPLETDASIRALAHVRWIQVVACLFLFMFARVHVHQIVAGSIRYDDAFIATVAKNLALGFGYSMSYHDLDLYDPHISTGPSIVVPTAFFIRLFGNQYWVPNLSITIAIWTTFILLLVFLRRHVGKRYFPLAVAFLSAGLVLFATSQFGLLGELPAVFLVGSAFLLLADDSGSDRAKGIAAGLALGVALNAKLIVMFTFPAIVIVPLMDAAARRMTGRGSQPNWRRVGWCLAALPLPILAWQVYQVIAASGSLTTWAAIKVRELRFLAGSESQSGVGQLRHAAMPVERFLHNLVANLGVFSGYFGGWARLVPGIASLAAAFVAVSTSRRVPQRSKYISRLLLCAALLHFGWWLVVSPTGFYRHLLPGVIYTLVLGAVLMATITSVSWRWGLATAAACGLTAALLLPGGPRMNEMEAAWIQSPRTRDFGQVFKWDFQKEPRLTALLQTRDELMNLQTDSSVLLIGCGWWVARDLEYALPRVNNFKDCYRLQPDETRGKRVVLVRNEIFNTDNLETLKRYQEYCERHILYRNEPYVVSECRGPHDHTGSQMIEYPVKWP